MFFFYNRVPVTLCLCVSVCVCVFPKGVVRERIYKCSFGGIGSRGPRICLHDKMSGSQRMRKSSPCSTSKQGPMRATLPMSSLLRQNSSLKKSNSNSPTVSPTNAWRARISPDQSSSGQRSPGSLSYKGNAFYIITR